jgi:hypothetical protein
MGVKSTTTLTRDEAVQRYVSFKTDLKRRKWELQAIGMSDRQLGDALDDLADQAYNQRNDCTDGGFDNFNVYDG